MESQARKRRNARRKYEFFKEQQKAAGHTYNITNFSGVLGDVSGDTIQIGDYNNVHIQLKKLGVSQEERNELENIVDALKTVPPTQRVNLLQRGSEAC